MLERVLVDRSKDRASRIGRHVRGFVVGLLPWALAACLPLAEVVSGEHPSETPWAAREVVVTPLDRLEPAGVLLDVLDICVEADDSARAFAALRARGIGLHADAVVAARFDPRHAACPHAHVSGVAIAYLGRDVPYEVLAEIVVDAPHGISRESVQLLRDRADGLGADALLDAALVRDDDSTRVQLAALAIRYL